MERQSSNVILIKNNHSTYLTNIIFVSRVFEMGEVQNIGAVLLHLGSEAHWVGCMCCKMV